MSTVEPTRPRPTIGVDSAPFWEYVARRELRVQRCTGCGALRLPPGPVCRRCWSDDHVWIPVSGRGVLHSWVTFHRQYHPAFPVPYTIGLVELAEGPRIEAPIVETNPKDLAWRRAVELVWQEHDGFVVPAFRIAPDPADDTPEDDA